MFDKLQSEVRRPVVAGAFYPSGAQELESTIGALLSQATKRGELGHEGLSIVS
jgi:AmmeMemoRadiSam system protein B